MLSDKVLLEIIKMPKQGKRISLSEAKEKWVAESHKHGHWILSIGIVKWALIRGYTLFIERKKNVETYLS